MAIIQGIHHITAIASNAQQNLDFYVKVLGQRLVKRTVNFDDPYTYHLYYGDKVGSPGSIMTFFPWPDTPRGKRGPGQVTSVSYSMPFDAWKFWKNRLETLQVPFQELTNVFGEEAIRLEDPDGIQVQLVKHNHPDPRVGWVTAELTEGVALKGFYAATLSVTGFEKTAELLTRYMNYEKIEEKENVFRFKSKNLDHPSFLDVECTPGTPYGYQGSGIVHHIAFRVESVATQAEIAEALSQAGFETTPSIDRKYFHSIYFREAGGILFEIATDSPGFAVDEQVDKLGSELKLPEWFEPSRALVEASLPTLAI